MHQLYPAVLASRLRHVVFVEHHQGERVFCRLLRPDGSARRVHVCVVFSSGPDPGLRRSHAGGLLIEASNTPQPQRPERSGSRLHSADASMRPGDWQRWVTLSVEDRDVFARAQAFLVAFCDAQSRRHRGTGPEAD